MRWAHGRLIAAFLVLLSQSTDGQDNRSESVDDLFPAGDMEEGLVEQLQWILDHPYELNQVTAGQLGFIPGVSSVDAARIISYRRSHGPFLAVGQLEEVEGLSDGVASLLRSFVIVRSNLDIDEKPLLLGIRARAVRDLQVSRGYSDGVYLGTPEKLYLRSDAIQKNGFSGGFLLEKDAGESGSAGFLSAYLSYTDPEAVFNIVAGDFRIETGQGLVVWSGSGSRGSDPSASPFRKGRGVVPHRSAEEVRFFRGIAAKSSVAVGDGNLNVLLFASRRSLSGTADSAGSEISLDVTGLSRTSVEAERQGAFREDLFGIDLGFTTGSLFSIGLTSYRSELLHRHVGSVDTRVVTGVHGIFHGERFEMYGEVAATNTGSVAWILGAHLRLARPAAVVVSHRRYSPLFLNNHAAAFGVRSDSRNETGMQLGVILRPTGGVRFSFGFERTHFPERTRLAAVATNGFELISQLDLGLGKSSDLVFRFQSGRREGNETVSDPYGRDVRRIVDERSQRGRVTFTHLAGRNIRFRFRFELVDIPVTPVDDGERGTMVFLDCRVRWPTGLQADARMIFFQTGSFRSRIYEFENDVRGSFSVPPLFGTGVRWYGLLQYEPAPGLRLSFRYSETWKEGVHELGSGLGTISGDLENDLAIQVDLSL